MQERYSLVSACTFLVSLRSIRLDSDFDSTYGVLQGTLISRAFASEELGDAKTVFIGAHGRPLMHALLCGFAGTAPRSVAPNLIELLSTLLFRCPAESRSWISDILYAVSCRPVKCFDRVLNAFPRALVA